MAIYHDRASRTEPKSGGYAMPVSAVTNKTEKERMSTTTKYLTEKSVHSCDYQNIRNATTNVRTHIVLNTASTAS